MQTDKYDRELIDAIDKWEPKLVEQVKTIENECGFPTVIYRSPSRLIKECEDAYDCGCVIAALTLVLTIPDVCSRLDGTDYRPNPDESNPAATRTVLATKLHPTRCGKPPTHLLRKAQDSFLACRRPKSIPTISRLRACAWRARPDPRCRGKPRRGRSTFRR